MRMTYGQLIDAANAKRSEAWDHTSMTLALIYNTNKGERQRASTPDDWHPLRRQPKRESNFTAANVKAAHAALAKQRPVKLLTGRVIDNDDY